MAYGVWLAKEDRDWLSKLLPPDPPHQAPFPMGLRARLGRVQFGVVKAGQMPEQVGSGAIFHFSDEEVQALLADLRKRDLIDRHPFARRLERVWKQGPLPLLPEGGAESVKLRTERPDTRYFYCACGRMVQGRLRKEAHERAHKERRTRAHWYRGKKLEAVKERRKAKRLARQCSTDCVITLDSRERDWLVTHIEAGSLLRSRLERLMFEDIPAYLRREPIFTPRKIRLVESDAAFLLKVLREKGVERHPILTWLRAWEIDLKDVPARAARRAERAAREAAQVTEVPSRPPLDMTATPTDLPGPKHLGPMRTHTLYVDAADRDWIVPLLKQESPLRERFADLPLSRLVGRRSGSRVTLPTRTIALDSAEVFELVRRIEWHMRGGVVGRFGVYQKLVGWRDELKRLHEEANALPVEPPEPLEVIVISPKPSVRRWFRQRVAASAGRETTTSLVEALVERAEDAELAVRGRAQIMGEDAFERGGHHEFGAVGYVSVPTCTSVLSLTDGRRFTCSEARGHGPKHRGTDAETGDVQEWEDAEDVPPEPARLSH